MARNVSIVPGIENTNTLPIVLFPSDDAKPRSLGFSAGSRRRSGTGGALRPLLRALNGQAMHLYAIVSELTQQSDASSRPDARSFWIRLVRMYVENIGPVSP
jgi:hypothetical protein